MLTVLALAFVLYCTTHNTNIHVPGGIRIRTASKRPAAADLRLSPFGHWDRQDSIPGPSNPERDAIPTELSRLTNTDRAGNQYQSQARTHLSVVAVTCLQAVDASARHQLPPVRQKELSCHAHTQRSNQYLQRCSEPHTNLHVLFIHQHGLFAPCVPENQCNDEERDRLRG